MTPFASALTEAMNDFPVNDPTEPETHWSQLSRLHEDAGAEGAWAYFTSTYSPFVRRYLRGALRAPADAVLEEGVSRFWTYAWIRRVAPAADPRRSFRAFLIGVIFNFAREFRRELGDETSNTGHDPGLVAASPDGGDAGASHEWALCILETSFDRLRAAHAKSAEALRLFYGLDCARQKGRSISAQLGVADVNALLWQARRRLRRIIRDVLVHSVLQARDVEEELGQLRRALARDRRGPLLEVESPTDDPTTGATDEVDQ